MLDVLAIGNAIVDVIASATDEDLARLGVVKGAMQLVDAGRADLLYDAMGPAVEISGGSAANTAAGVASFGGAAGFVGKVRDDQFGTLYRHDLRATGVTFDVAPAPADAPDPTGRCMVLVTPEGERTMNTNLGIATSLTPDDVDPALVSSSAVVYAEAYLWDSPSARAAIVRAMQLAAAAGARVAFSLSDPFCADRHRAEFAALVEDRVDVLFANEAEVCSLYEVQAFDEALQRVRHHVELAFLTRSEHGSVIVAGDEVHVVEAHPVGRVVDATGAGDLYAAGALFGLTSGIDLVTCGRLAALAAAEVIAHLGARPQTSLAALARREGLLR